MFSSTRSPFGPGQQGPGDGDGGGPRCRGEGGTDGRSLAARGCRAAATPSGESNRLTGMRNYLKLVDKNIGHKIKSR